MDLFFQNAVFPSKLDVIPLRRNWVSFSSCKLLSILDARTNQKTQVSFDVCSPCQHLICSALLNNSCKYLIFYYSQHKTFFTYRCSVTLPLMEAEKKINKSAHCFYQYHLKHEHCTVLKNRQAAGVLKDYCFWPFSSRSALKLQKGWQRGKSTRMYMASS